MELEALTSIFREDLPHSHFFDDVAIMRASILSDFSATLGPFNREQIARNV